MFDFALILDYVKMLPLLFILIVAAYQDLTRSVKVQTDKEVFVCGEVSNRLWLYLPVGFGLLLAELFLIPNLVLFAVGSLVFSIVVGFLLYGLHGWGGADLKAFLLVGFCMPVFPLRSFLFPFPLPFLVLLVACLSMVLYVGLKKSDVPFGKRKVRFMPFILLGYIVALLV